MSNQKNPPAPRGEKFIFVDSYWNKKANRRIYASDYGLKAFRFRVRK